MTDPMNIIGKSRVDSILDSDILKVYIDDILHLAVYYPNINGVQTWIESESTCMIRFYLKDGATITSKYHSYKTFVAVAKEIDKHV